MKVLILLLKGCVGIWLLATQKPINRPGWWKGSLLYFRCWQLVHGRGEGWRVGRLGEWGADICPKADTPHIIEGENFYRVSVCVVGRGLHAETAQSSLTVIFKLVLSGLTSIILVVLHVSLVTLVMSDSVTPWLVTCQAPLSMGFSRQEYWSGFPISFSRGSSQPRNWTQVSYIFCIGRQVLYHECHLGSFR